MIEKRVLMRLRVTGSKSSSVKCMCIEDDEKKPSQNVYYYWLSSCLEFTRAYSFFLYTFL